MARNFKYLETYTVENFKAKTESPSLKPFENGGSVFFLFGKHHEKRGFCSNKQLPKHPVVSLVIDKDSDPKGESPFFLLHESATEHYNWLTEL